MVVADEKYSIGTVGEQGTVQHVIVIDEATNEREIGCGVRRGDKEIRVTSAKEVAYGSLGELQEGVTCAKCLKKYYNVDTKSIGNRGKRTKKANLVENRLREALETSARLREHQEDKKVTLADEIRKVAENIGVSVASINYIVYSGGSTSLYMALKLSGELGVDVTEIFYLGEEY